MLEITDDYIALLSDGDLRNLIGLLCEADLRKRALPASVVTWSGDQDAKDGGIDVRVALPASALSRLSVIDVGPCQSPSRARASAGSFLDGRTRIRDAHGAFSPRGL